MTMDRGALPAGELVQKVLGLKLAPVGVKFLSLEDQYNRAEAGALARKATVCQMARLAGEGEHFKAMRDHFGCAYGVCALGVERMPEGLDAGEAYARCGLYDGYVTAHNVMRSFRYCTHRAFGIEMAPVDLLEAPDVVVMFGTAEQCMRLMQGYAYYFGAPEHMCTLGNQAVCSDLIAKVFTNNDVNISLLCRGARFNGRFEPGEMGLGIPCGKFERLVDGVIKTVNPVSMNQEKDAILARLGTPDIAGTAVEYNTAYGAALTRYGAYVAEEAARVSGSKR